LPNPQRCCPTTQQPAAKQTDRRVTEAVQEHVDGKTFTQHNQEIETKQQEWLKQKGLA
jgi:hypothetical protein